MKTLGELSQERNIFDSSNLLNRPLKITFTFRHVLRLSFWSFSLRVEENVKEYKLASCWYKCDAAAQLSQIQNCVLTNTELCFWQIQNFKPGKYNCNVSFTIWRNHKIKYFRLKRSCWESSEIKKSYLELWSKFHFMFWKKSHLVLCGKLRISQPRGATTLTNVRPSFFCEFAWTLRGLLLFFLFQSPPQVFPRWIALNSNSVLKIDHLSTQRDPTITFWPPVMGCKMTFFLGNSLIFSLFSFYW